MIRSHVQSWLSSNVQEDPTTDDESASWHRDRIIDNWQTSMEYAQNVLLHSKTSTRVLFLSDELLTLAKNPGMSFILVVVPSRFDGRREDLNLSQMMDVFKILTLTYPLYPDSHSRDAVEKVIIELIRQDVQSGLPADSDNPRLGITNQILGWLSNEANSFVKRNSPKCGPFLRFNNDCLTSFFHSSYAPSTFFVLLSWSCRIFTTYLTVNPHFPSTNGWNVLLGSMATLIEMLTAADGAKRSMVNGALVRVRRALRSVYCLS